MRFIKITEQIEFKGMPLRVEGNFYPSTFSGDYLQPPDPDELEIDRVMLEDLDYDLWPLFLALDRELEIEELTIHKIKGGV